MSGNAQRLAEAANQIFNSQPVTEVNKVASPQGGNKKPFNPFNPTLGDLLKSKQQDKKVDTKGKSVKEAYKAGDKVKVPHKGKMVKGKIVRYDDGGSDKARQSGGGYVVDVGEPASILVPANKVVKEAAEQIDELSKMRRLGQTVGAIIHGKPTPSDRLKDAKDKLAYKRYMTPERKAQEAEIDAKIRKLNAAVAIEEIKRILDDHDKQERAMIISGIKSIKESAEITEAPYTPANDYEGEMAMTQLKSVIEKATETLAMLKPEAKMEAWVQSKITLCDEHISSVRDYLKHTPGSVE